MAKQKPIKTVSPCHGEMGAVGRCKRNAPITRDGKTYCWQHDPVRLAELREEQRLQAVRRWDEHVSAATAARARSCQLRKQAGIPDVIPDDILEQIIARGGLQAMLDDTRPRADISFSQAVGRLDSAEALLLSVTMRNMEITAREEGLTRMEFLNTTWLYRGEEPVYESKVYDIESAYLEHNRAGFIARWDDDTGWSDIPLQERTVRSDKECDNADVQ